MATRSMSALEQDAANHEAMVVNLDGSTGEGGGQILRNAISYAIILQRKLSITNIRAKRPKPGLRAQHVAALQLPVQLYGGTLTGDVVGSSTISYTPRKYKSKEEDESSSSYTTEATQDIGTAGSICLLLQASLPCALLSKPYFDTALPTRLHLMGGTNAALAPQYDYWHDVFLPILQQQCGLDASNQVKDVVETRGYFPRGGGKVHVTVTPLEPTQTLQPIQLTERGDLESITIRSFHAGKLPRHLAQEMATAAQRCLQQEGLIVLMAGGNKRSNSGKPTVQVNIVHERNAVGSALGILVVATTTMGCKFAGSALSRPGQLAAHVGQAAAQELIQAWKSGGCVDEWLQDQLILYMALADGLSQVMTGCLTLHTQTAIWTAEQFLGANLFEVQKLDEDDDDNNNNNNSAFGDFDPNLYNDQPFQKKQKLPETSVRPRNAEVQHGKFGVASTTTKTTTTTTTKKQFDYGQEALIPGRHLIRCHGIGFKRI